MQDKKPLFLDFPPSWGYLPQTGVSPVTTTP